MKLKLNDVFREVEDLDPSLYRVLWLNRAVNQLTCINIPTGEAASKWYRKGPKRFKFDAVEQALISNQIALLQLKPPAIILLSDDEIRRRYPSSVPGKEPTLLRIRDTAWGWISPLFDDYTTQEIFEHELLTSWITQRAQQLNIGENRIYNALHRYWIGGSNKNALLPDTPLCGKRKDGKPRIYRKKPGKKNALSKKGDLSREGVILTDNDKAFLQAGWRFFVKTYSTVHDAFLLTSAAWWSDGIRIVDGKEQPELKPAHQRPTESQFRYWGPQGETEKEAWKQLLVPGDYERNYRGLIGSARDGIVSVGQVGFADATPSDQHLVSLIDRLSPVGKQTRLILKDAFSEVIPGFYCGYGAPSGRTALLAVLHAATPKGAFLERFDIEYIPEEWPEIFFSQVHTDNGELRNQLSLDTMRDLHSTLEYIPRGRADLNNAEAGHHTLHRLHDHRNVGTTHGRPKKRGEESAIENAAWTWWEYTRELIRAIRYYNNRADASHLLTVQMKRDGVAPNRVAIYHWACEQGYIASISHDIELLRVKLLPTIDAVVHENGVFLLRSDRGFKKEIIPNLRYVSQYLIECDWLEKARRSGSFRTKVYHHPMDISSVWFTDDNGLHELKNATPDPILNIEATLQDCLFLHDWELYGRCDRQTDSDQDNLDFVYGRETTNDLARELKQKAINGADHKVTKTEMRSGVKAKRLAEKARLASTVSNGQDGVQNRMITTDTNDNDTILNEHNAFQEALNNLKAKHDHNARE